MRAAAKYGFRISATHVSGARGFGMYLDELEKLVKDYPAIAEQRWAVDHVNDVSAEQRGRAAKLGMIFSVMPRSLYQTASSRNAYEIVYGEEEAGDRMQPNRTLIDLGLRPVIELDQHNFHPSLALQVFVTRKNAFGKVLGAQQRVGRREALYMYTRWSAEYLLRENVLGSIEPGKAADFAVLNRDYLTVPEDEISQIDPVLMVMGGKILYSEPRFANSQGLPTVGFQGDRSKWIR